MPSSREELPIMMDCKVDSIVKEKSLQSMQVVPTLVSILAKYSIFHLQPGAGPVRRTRWLFLNGNLPASDLGDHSVQPSSGPSKHWYSPGCIRSPTACPPVIRNGHANDYSRGQPGVRPKATPGSTEQHGQYPYTPIWPCEYTTMSEQSTGSSIRI